MLNTYDTKGGAAIAATRLWKGLLDVGVDAHFMVQEKFGRDPRIIGPATNFGKGMGILRPHIDRLPLAFYPNRENTFWSVQWLPGNVVNKINEINPDIVHLHWVNNGYLPIQALPKIKQPIVWTLHDSWAFTGGCHVPQECEKFKTICHQCPQLNSGKKKDLSYRTFRKKQKYWQDINLTIVCLSEWIENNVKASSILNGSSVTRIPNGIDTNIYKPISKVIARDILHLPKDKKLILFGALNPTSDQNKGFHLLQAALKKFSSQTKEDVELVIFGTYEPSQPVDLGLKAHYVGWLNDDPTLALLYSSADVMVVPSLQEVFPTTAIESVACGTPVVAFNATGLKDIVEHKASGYLAAPYDPIDLANGLHWILEDESLRKELSVNARNHTLQHFGIHDVAAKYIELYRKVLAG